MGRSTKLFLLVLVLLFTTEGHADPVFGEVFDLRQPDGSIIKARVWGDEFYRVVETLDGYTVVRDPQSRQICYAKLSADGNELVSTGLPANTMSADLLLISPHIRVNKESIRAKIKAARDRIIPRGIQLFSGPEHKLNEPSAVNVRGICILIDFEDEPNSQGALLPVSHFF